VHMSPPNKQVVYRKPRFSLCPEARFKSASSAGTRHYLFMGVRRNSLILRGKWIPLRIHRFSSLFLSMDRADTPESWLIRRDPWALWPKCSASCILVSDQRRNNAEQPLTSRRLSGKVLGWWQV